MMKALSTAACAWLLTLSGCNSDTLQGTGGPFSTNIYVATNAGVSVSLNGGSSWTTIGSLSNVFSVFTVNSGTFISVYAATSGGLYVSTDGTNWVQNLALGTVQVNDVYVSGTNVYAATSNGISVSTTSGDSWTSTLVAGGATAISVVSTNVYVGTASSGIWVSSDNGTTWTSYTNAKTSGGLPSDHVSSVYDNGSTLYVGTDQGLTQTSNTLNSWTPTVAATTPGLAGNVVNEVFVSGNTIYVATSQGLSVDTGAAWITYYFGSASVNAVYATGTYIYVAAGNGVWISLDSGVTWKNCFAGNSVRSITVQ